MTKSKSFSTKIFILIFSILLSALVYGQPYYSVDNLNIEAKINKDGTVDVSEFAQYKAQGINGIYYDIDYKGYGDLKNLQVFYEKDSEFIPATNNLSHKKGTYTTKDNDGLRQIKLYFPMSGKRWFLFKYTLSKGVTVYKDIAQFNRKMIGQGWKTDIDNVEVKIILPKNTNKNNIKAFGHGQLTGNVDIVSGREIVYTLENYMKGKFVETNILFPKELVSNINPALIKNENGYEKIMKMENDLADKTDIQRKLLQKKGSVGNIVFFSFWGWVIFVVELNYIKNRKKHRVIDEPREYFNDIPDKFSPAVGGAIACGHVEPRQLLATVVDLVRRDVLEMVEDRESNETILRKKDYDESLLKNYERFIIAWYIDELGNGVQISMEEIERIIKDRRSAIAFGKNYEKWEAMVRKDLENVGFKIEKKHKIPMILGILTAFLSLPAGVFLTEYFEDRKFIYFPFAFFLIMVSTVSGKRYTLEAEKLRVRWVAFKKFLMGYGNLKDAKIISMHIWEYYFVYAIAMGVSEEVAKGYSKIVEESDEDRRNYNRMPFMRMYNRNSSLRNIERTVTNSINRGTRALSSTRSSSRGSGGGFSGGSSGGGGSRGGGGAF
ncbi:DUF2207 domain-containing protein [Fusobacterium sp.]|uniref:DUF2207 family protein n=1 Tax=Fusobacterium sp. TaxID=68766 RepID=UPI00263933EF|nr:DUF2207 domain-containing protein [Fusobacterium sp.]